MKPVKAGFLNCSEVVAELLRQPEFFDFHRQGRDDLPEAIGARPDLSTARYSGARSDDEAVNLRVGAMRLLGMSDRAIERECGVDRRTIPHRLAYLEKSGRIPAVKDRVLVWTADAAERSGIVLASLLDRAHGEVSADLASMIKAVAVAHGVTVEKLQLLTGQATEIIEHKVGAGREEQEAWAKAHGLPIDCESTKITPESSQIGALPLSRYVHDTSSAADPALGNGPCDTVPISQDLAGGIAETGEAPKMTTD